jgi:sugar phosphate isomerase/epimerase
MIRLSCADYGWPSVRLPTALAVISDLGFNGVDIGVFGDVTHVTVRSVTDDPAARAATVAADARGVGLDVADVFLTASLDLARVTPTSRYGDDQEELRRIFRAMVEFALALDAPGVTLLPGVVARGQSVSEAIRLAAEGLAPLVAMGAEAGRSVSIEPHVGSCIESPGATGDLLARCDGLTVTLDASHFAYQGWPVETMLDLLPRTRHVQIRPAGTGVMQAKVRDNGLDLGLLVRSLVASGYSSWIASEYVWMEKWVCDEVDNTGESGLLRELLVDLLGAAA